MSLHAYLKYRSNGLASQIQLIFCFNLISILIQNFAHDMRVVLLCHLQSIVAIWLPGMKLQQDEIAIEFEIRENK